MAKSKIIFTFTPGKVKVRKKIAPAEKVHAPKKGGGYQRSKEKEVNNEE